MLTVCLASDKEALSFCEAPREGIRIRVTGYRNALLEPGQFQPTERILVAGTAGALRNDLATAAIFLPTEVHSSEGNFVGLSSNLQLAMRETLAANQIDFVEGRLVTMPHPVVSSEERSVLNRRFDAVDMETFDLIEPLVRQGTELAVIRIISDQANERASEHYRHRLSRLSDKMSAVLNLVAKKLGSRCCIQ